MRLDVSMHVHVSETYSDNFAVFVFGKMLFPVVVIDFLAVLKCKTEKKIMVRYSITLRLN